MSHCEGATHRSGLREGLKQFCTYSWKRLVHSQCREVTVMRFLKEMIVSTLTRPARKLHKIQATFRNIVPADIIKVSFPMQFFFSVTNNAGFVNVYENLYHISTQSSLFQREEISSLESFV